MGSKSHSSDSAIAPFQRRASTSCWRREYGGLRDKNREGGEEERKNN